MAGRYWVYILTNRRHGALYVGVTNTLARRMAEHREGRGSQFAAKHGLVRLVYAEACPTALEAIAHEKRMKRWRRAWKLDLIESVNPGWDDLSGTIHLE
jgi:putative endonuclease